eukprot:2374386-Rhodomonas_salina.5
MHHHNMMPNEDSAGPPPAFFRRRRGRETVASLPELKPENSARRMFNRAIGIQIQAEGLWSWNSHAAEFTTADGETRSTSRRPSTDTTATECECSLEDSLLTLLDFDLDAGVDDPMNDEASECYNPARSTHWPTTSRSAETLNPDSVPRLCTLG